MSFILDALKKSETDRQRQSGPSLFEVKVAPPQRRLPVWAVAIGILLLVNVIVISWMLLRHPAAQQAPPAATPPATAMVNQGVSGETVPLAVPGGRADTPSGSGARAPGSRGGTTSASGASPAEGAAARDAASPTGSSQAPASSSQPSAAAPTAAGGADGGGQPPAADNPSDNAPAVEPAAAAGSGAAERASMDLPLYQQIVTSDSLPALHLDLHVFADHPQDRFVMINMQRLGEGDSLTNGVQVEAIRSDGVVLSYHGTRFLLPRN